MNNFTFFLGFILIIYILSMAFPKRGRKASKCVGRLARALFISKAFQAAICYFNAKKSDK